MPKKYPLLRIAAFAALLGFLTGDTLPGQETAPRNPRAQKNDAPPPPESGDKDKDKDAAAPQLPRGRAQPPPPIDSAFGSLELRPAERPLERTSR